MSLNKGSGRIELPIPPGHPVDQIAAWYHLPETLPPDSPIVIVLHGTSRAAEVSRNNWSKEADRYGFFVVVPDFPEHSFSDMVYAYGNFWSPQPPHVLHEWRQSLGAVIDCLFEKVRTELGYRNQSFVLYGHSAGAALAHRYLTLAPKDMVSQAIFANAGWYTMLDRDQPIPFGLGGATVPEVRLRRMLEKPVTVLVGDRDRSGPYLDWWPSRHITQGPHRVARSQAYFESAKRMAAQLATPCNWKWQSVPGVAHENAKMIPPAAALIAAMQP